MTTRTTGRDAVSAIDAVLNMLASYSELGDEARLAVKVGLIVVKMGSTEDVTSELGLLGVSPAAANAAGAWLAFQLADVLEEPGTDEAADLAREAALAVDVQLRRDVLG
jgi:hypothetical protein